MIFHLQFKLYVIYNLNVYVGNIHIAALRTFQGAIAARKPQRRSI